jgi:CheY-like chemotaxis protein
MQTILIVDDEAHLRSLIHQALEELEDEGVELMTAANGEEALAAIQESKPNLVFLCSPPRGRNSIASADRRSAPTST